MNNLFDNKKGGEKLLSIWWFFVLALIGVGIVGGVLLFYSADVDIRNLESEILYERVADCLIKQGFLISEIFSENFNISEKCKLNQDVFNDEGNFYFKISFYNEAGGGIREDIKQGNLDFESQCKIQEENGDEIIKARHYAKCTKQKEFAFYYQNNELKKAVVEISTASNQIGKKIPVAE